MGKTNTVTLIGNLGKDVELKHFDNGGCIGRTTLATKETYTNKTSGEKVEDVEWHNLVFRGKGAEIVEKYCEKGSKLAIIGRIKYRSWEGQDGNKKYMTEIKVRDFEFLDSKGAKTSTNSQTATNSAPYNNESDQGDHDDLPF